MFLLQPPAPGPRRPQLHRRVAPPPRHSPVRVGRLARKPYPQPQRRAPFHQRCFRLGLHHRGRPSPQGPSPAHLHLLRPHWRNITGRALHLPVIVCLHAKETRAAARTAPPPPCRPNARPVHSQRPSRIGEPGFDPTLPPPGPGPRRHGGGAQHKKEEPCAFFYLGHLQGHDNTTAVARVCAGGKARARRGSHPEKAAQAAENEDLHAKRHEPGRGAAQRGGGTRRDDARARRPVGRAGPDRRQTKVQEHLRAGAQHDGEGKNRAARAQAAQAADREGGFETGSGAVAVYQRSIHSDTTSGTGGTNKGLLHAEEGIQQAGGGGVRVRYKVLRERWGGERVRLGAGRRARECARERFVAAGGRAAVVYTALTDRLSVGTAGLCATEPMSTFC